MQVIQSDSRHADGMSRVLHKVLMSWDSPRPFAPEYVDQHYIGDPNRISCAVALDDDGVVIGFQSLKYAPSDNIYDVPEGWGVIGTYVDLDQTRGGVGSALFAVTIDAMRQAGLAHVDATIGDDNPLGLGYYEKMGFRTYDTIPGAIRKRLDL